jgi:hypothetical protein
MAGVVRSQAASVPASSVVASEGLILQCRFKWTFSTPEPDDRVDSAFRALHDTLSMVEAQFEVSRRSSRIFTRIPVRAAGMSMDGRKFRENSQTIVVNAHGGLLYLHEPIEMGAQIVLINPVTEEEQECRIVFLGDSSEKGQRIGVEFLSPAPHFWGVEFAPEDWPGRRNGHPHR